jgi:hypothetical protein
MRENFWHPTLGGEPLPRDPKHTFTKIGCRHLLSRRDAQTQLIHYPAPTKATFFLEPHPRARALSWGLEDPLERPDGPAPVAKAPRPATTPSDVAGAVGPASKTVPERLFTSEPFAGYATLLPVPWASANKPAQRLRKPLGGARYCAF